MCVGFRCRFLESGRPNHLLLYNNSALREVLARNRWSLHVCLSHFPHVQFNPPCPAGSSSLPLTTNGGLSGAISPTGGRYGSVTIDASLWFQLPCCALGLISSLVRFTPSPVCPLSWVWSLALPAWTLQPQLIVKWVPRFVYLTSALIGHNVKPLVLFAVVGTLSYMFLSQRREFLLPSCISPRFFFICLGPPLRYWLFFACTPSSTTPPSGKFQESGAHWRR